VGGGEGGRAYTNTELDVRTEINVTMLLEVSQRLVKQQQK
jgi:hypothetical protein